MVLKFEVTFSWGHTVIFSLETGLFLIQWHQLGHDIVFFSPTCLQSFINLSPSRMFVCLSVAT